MKAIITEIKIEKPCSKNWDEMENQKENKFCLSCNKCVIDFSGLTNAEIIKILVNTSGEVCGRLAQTQLNQLNYQLTVVPVNRNWMKYLGVFAIGASIFMQAAKASTPKASTTISSNISKVNDKKPSVITKIKGYVLNADKKPLAGIRLVITNTKYFALTDKDGRYEIIFDKGINIKNATLIVESIRYAASKQINYSSEKQSDLILNRMEPMILGRIMVTKKGTKF